MINDELAKNTGGNDLTAWHDRWLWPASAASRPGTTAPPTAATGTNPNAAPRRSPAEPSSRTRGSGGHVDGEADTRATDCRRGDPRSERARRRSAEVSGDHAGRVVEMLACSLDGHGNHNFGRSSGTRRQVLTCVAPSSMNAGQIAEHSAPGLRSAAGRVGRAKTVHLLAMCDPEDETYRRTVHTRFTVHGSRRGLASNLAWSARWPILYRPTAR